MSDIKVTVNDKQVLNLIGLMRRQGLNMKTPFRQSSYIMHSDVIKRFTDESDEKGQKWKPLSPLTIMMRKKRRKKATSVGILKDTGRLRQSIRPKSNEHGAEVSTNVEYAAIHNFGGTINHPGGTKFGFLKGGEFGWKKKDNSRFIGITKPHKINIPARPFMSGLSDDAKDKIIRLFQIHLFKNRT